MNADTMSSAVYSTIASSFSVINEVICLQSHRTLETTIRSSACRSGVPVMRTDEVFSFHSSGRM